VCEAIFSSSSGPHIVLNPLTPQSFPTGLVLGGEGSFFLSWDAYPGALCYSVYKADTSDPFGSYTIIAECIPNPPFNIEPFGFGCYRISAITANGETPLSLPTCISAPPPIIPSVVTDAATNITGTGAQLNGFVSPNGNTTEVYFEWGLSMAYGNMAGNHSVGTSETAFDTTLTGLSNSTTYHFRAVASNITGTVFGADMSFETSGSALVPPLVWWKMEEPDDDPRIDATGGGWTLFTNGMANGPGIIAESAVFTPSDPNFYFPSMSGQGSNVKLADDFSFSVLFAAQWDFFDNNTQVNLAQAQFFTSLDGMGDVFALQIQWHNNVLSAAIVDGSFTPHISVDFPFIPSLGQFHFFNVYYSGGQISIRIDNGSPLTSAGSYFPPGVPILGMTNNITVVAISGPTDPLAAQVRLDEYSIWSPVLSTTATDFIYNGGLWRTYPF
jgi:hypothetical protein